ncbi:MAG: HAMP domain-containing histidine kinase [Clostridia bacterium]|nr:HAMP domain-containing histidine kinase [Clostridia bacterium]
MKKRILLVSIVIMFAALIAFAVTSVEVYYNSSLESAKNTLSVYMNCLSLDGYGGLEDAADGFSDQLGGLRVTIIYEDGAVAADSDYEDVSVLENHSDREEVSAAMTSEDGEGYAVRSSSSLGEDMIYYCRAFSYNGGVIYVRIGMPSSNEWSMLADSLPTIIIYMVIEGLLCLLFTYIATTFILNPVEKLAREAALSKPVATKYSELKPIAEILNERNEEMQKKIAELEEEKEIAEQAQNSKNEFISNITHEMNTPLTSIRGYAELLASGMMTDDQQQAAYKTILKQSERLTNLIACIINYSEIDNMNINPYEVDFSKLCREMIAVVKPEADKRNIAIIDEICDGVTVQSNHEMMSELAGNLLRNAIRYNKEGGSVTVRLTDEIFEVSDTGIGIAKENMDKVFSRFFTVDKSHSGKNGGFGLGLAMVRKICHRHGWTISVQSEEGVGSTFTVKFKPKI